MSSSHFPVLNELRDCEQTIRRMAKMNYLVVLIITATVVVSNIFQIWPFGGAVIATTCLALSFGTNTLARKQL